jgi:hypothetical protein
MKLRKSFYHQENTMLKNNDEEKFTGLKRSDRMHALPPKEKISPK